MSWQTLPPELQVMCGKYNRVPAYFVDIYYFDRDFDNSQNTCQTETLCFCSRDDIGATLINEGILDFDVAFMTKKSEHPVGLVGRLGAKINGKLGVDIPTSVYGWGDSIMDIMISNNISNKKLTDCLVELDVIEITPYEVKSGSAFVLNNF